MRIGEKKNMLPPHPVPFQTPQRKPHLALSLVELIVVLGVIAVLAAILVPVTGRITNRTKEMTCLNNLRSIGAANVTYANDHQGTVIVGSNGDPNYWWLQIRPYLGVNFDFSNYDLENFLKTLVCPADSSRGGTGTAWGTYPLQQRSYAINRVSAPWRSDLGRNEPVRIQSVPAPSRMAYCGDYDWHLIGTDWIDPAPARIDLVPRHRHEGRANFVFLDGHTESISIEELYPGKPKHYILQAQDL